MEIRARFGVAFAAQSVGMSRKSIYGLRKRVLDSFVSIA